jgi:hypothetical protein
MQYYQVRLDVYDPNIWYFDDILDIDNNWDLRNPAFYKGIPNIPLVTHVRHGDGETDYTDAGYASVPCISQRAKEALMTLPDILSQLDFLPLEICGHTPKQPYYAMVAKLLKDCVDESQSEWEPMTYDDGETPTSRGFLRKYGPFFKLKIDADRTDNLDIFRLEGAHLYLIASQRFKDLWQSSGFTGMTFSQGVNHLNL